HLPGVGLAALVLVGDDHDDSAAECIRVLVPPSAACAAGVAGRDDADPLEGMDVLLALDHVDDLAVLVGLDPLREAVQNAAGVFEAPSVAGFAGGVGDALAELLVGRPAPPEQQL